MTETPPNDQADFAVASVDRLEKTVDECLRVRLVRAASFEEEGEVVEGRATSRHQQEVCRTERSAIDRQMGGRRIVGVHAREKGPQIAQDTRLNPCSEIGTGLNRWPHATFFDRGVLTTRRTPTPSLANM